MAEIKKAKNLGEWLDMRLGTNKLVKVLMTEYWIPKNINFLWAMGVILLTLFGVLVVSGIFLLMYYKPDAKMAFDSVNFTIMQEVAYGWLWRHMHATAASMIFVIIYIHMFVGIYYGSYKKGREMIWISGMVLFVVFSAEAFSGYMLPWGQMSYWAAAVITNLFGGIPFIGADVVEWIRGNYVVADSTLTRFFMLHVFLLPIAIILLVGVHFYSLRIPHVNNQEGEEIDFELEEKKFIEGKKKESKVIPFWPVFLSKDIFVVCAFMVFFFYLVCYHYDFAMDPINFERANSLKTPPHIYPEWYFLWSYEVLRGFFFSADLGLMAFGVAQVIFFLLPFLDRSPVVAPAHKRPAFEAWFWLLIIDMIVLTIYGKLPPLGIGKYIGLVGSITFLALFFVVLPIITIAERKKQGGVR
ncbi:Ubiquinol cytochrome c oxidoreductase, cytochrome b subunit; putative membrane protein [Helicobacter pylori SJM180]|uniref:cytochrome b n=1 Tax=Helicobacter pylori TaxID=210 RepID=UPI0001E57C83|nr:cytochrome bc complex cytochrome b subunit [Helicobacter pylori]ADO03142.1 Ubiquinol cytochrome c oxidoreductase, cytochrome b subunit; putative membrane protein [Helicobacter pylori SJM180]KHL85276.1 ubiquinol cytochrome C oxidoreductase [Helicobacter pylori]NHB30386.1 cytochrome bc complex cytochrome b subunit [Helicobacter pylori]PUD34460.1 cytochrome bc complex cytochrome b subunit [Helicobacter pylori]RKV23266.1 cytochrome bc complex cytochrome b subunit [Helicobacter pylori]